MILMLVLVECWLTLPENLYASSLLYLYTLALAKTSILVLMSRIIIAKIHIKINRILSAIVLTWTLASIFGAAFQCELPHSWDYLGKKCFHVVSFQGHNAEHYADSVIGRVLVHHRRV